MFKSGFEKALSKFTSEANWLCAGFSSFAQDTDVVRGRFAAELVVIRLHDAWARFCREVVVVSAYGRIETLGGTRLGTCHPAIKSRGDVIPVLISLYPNRRAEPYWFSAADCSDAGRRLGIQNAATVTAALGAANSPAAELREVRNFYAHRKKETAVKAVTAGGFVGRQQPQVFHLNSFVAGGKTILESWTEDLIAVATAAVQ
jgi:hypothetical protein